MHLKKGYDGSITQQQTRCKNENIKAKKNKNTRNGEIQEWKQARIQGMKTNKIQGEKGAHHHRYGMNNGQPSTLLNLTLTK